MFAILYLFDMITWGNKNGWEFTMGIFISSQGIKKTIPEFYKLWIQYKGE